MKILQHQKPRSKIRSIIRFLAKIMVLFLEEHSRRSSKNELDSYEQFVKDLHENPDLYKTSLRKHP